MMEWTAYIFLFDFDVFDHSEYIVYLQKTHQSLSNKAKKGISESDAMLNDEEELWVK